MGRRTAAVLVALLIGAVPCIPALAGKGMFLKLHDVFNYEDHSITTAEFADGSTFTFECDRYVAERGVIADSDRPALVVRMICESQGRARRGTVVWLHGGPFGSAPETATAEQAALLSRGYDLIMPIYPGSSARSFYVTPRRITPDFDDAIAETEVAVRVAQRGGGRVVLVGESFGSILAAAASRLLREDDRFVLSRPMLRSYNALVPPEGNQVTGPIVIDGVPVTDKPLGEQSALMNETFERFAGPWLDRDVISILKPNPPRNLFVVYREKDPNSSVERMPELLSLGGNRYRTLPLPGETHDDIDSRALLDRFIHEVESWDKLAPRAAPPPSRARKRR
jgi:pimeloyl-ACP methyl ester carboxylesterase